MSATDKFLTEKRIAGATRNDTPPTVGDGEPASLRINSNSELIVSIGGGTGAVSVQGDTAHDDADTGNPVKTGGTATAAEAANVDEGDRVQSSYTLAGRQRIDADLTRIAGNSIVTAGVNGLQAVGGSDAHDAAATANPNRIAGVYRTVNPAVGDGDLCDILVDNAGQIMVGGITGTSDVNVAEVNGTTVIEAGDSGVIAVGGADAHDAAASANPVRAAGVYRSAAPSVSNGDIVDLFTDAAGRVQTLTQGHIADDAASDATPPNKIGAVADQVLSTVTDGDMVHLVADLYRRLITRSAAFDELVTADAVTNLNTDATDRDTAGQIDADETDIGAGTINFPSDDGRLYGTRNKRCWTLTLDDVTSCELQESDDGGTTWVPVTGSLLVRSTGLTGYPATYFTAPDGSPITYKVQMETPSAGIAYRWQVVINATNDILITTSGRAN